MSSNSSSILKGCLVIVAILTLVGVAVAIFGVKAVTSALERASEQQRELEQTQNDLDRTREELEKGGPSGGDEPEPPEIFKPDIHHDENPELAKRWDLPDVPVAKRGNTSISSFRGAKNILYDLHDELGLEKTFYCGCDYDNRKPDLKSCGYEIRKHEDRARRTEAEHVMPASRFGHTFSEWTKGHPDCVKRGRKFKGRKCAEQANDEFARMESDLYNLQPAIGEVNGDRLHYEWSELKGEAREYGKCDVEIRDQKVEPKKSIRGDIARTYLYMAWAYPSRVSLTDEEIAMFAQWDRDDPPTRAERKRARAIEARQGNVQPFIK